MPQGATCTSCGPSADGEEVGGAQEPPHGPEITLPPKHEMSAFRRQGEVNSLLHGNSSCYIYNSIAKLYQYAFRLRFRLVGVPLLPDTRC